MELRDMFSYSLLCCDKPFDRIHCTKIFGFYLIISSWDFWVQKVRRLSLLMLHLDILTRNQYIAFTDDQFGKKIFSLQTKIHLLVFDIHDIILISWFVIHLTFVNHIQLHHTRQLGNQNKSLMYIIYSNEIHRRLLVHQYRYQLYIGLLQVSHWKRANRWCWEGWM